MDEFARLEDTAAEQRSGLIARPSFSSSLQERAGLLAKVGLTLTGWKGVGKIVGIALFGAAFFGSDYLTVLFVRSSFSDWLIELLPVPTAQAPFFVAVFLTGVALATGLAAIGLLGIFAPDGYDNSYPRQMKSPSVMAGTFPVAFRVQSAHNNSLEWLGYMMPCFWAAHELGMEQRIFAKLSVFVLLCRIAYVIMYVVNEDFLRTSCFLLAVTALIDIGLGAVLPGNLSKYQ